MRGTNNEAMSTEDFLREIVFKTGGRGGEMRFRQVARPVADQAAEARASGWNEADHPRDDIGHLPSKMAGEPKGKKPTMLSAGQRNNTGKRRNKQLKGSFTRKSN